MVSKNLHCNRGDTVVRPGLIEMAPLGSLSLVADSFRFLPKEEETATEWTAREWAKGRKGWVLITSQPAEREALRPLHSVWIEMLVPRLSNLSSAGSRREDV